MTQIAAIVKSLKEVFASVVALAETLTGDLHHAERVDPETLKPFGLLKVAETGHKFNTSGVGLVSYEITLKIYVLENTTRTGEILQIFHHYFDRLNTLPALDADAARMVLIYPKPGGRIYEDKKDEYGKHIIVGEAVWGLRLSEHQQTIEE